MKEISDINKIYIHAAETIKQAILHSQYEAAKDVNRVQLATYYWIGKYVSLNTRKGFWGTKALEQISERVHKMLPEVRGYSAENLKKMRQFYEEWQILDIVAENIQPSVDNSVIAITELPPIEDEIDIFRELRIPNSEEFPVEDFFKVQFTHHICIFSGVKDSRARSYYLHRCVEEHLSTKALKRIIKENDYENQADIPNNFHSTLTNAQLARQAMMQFKDSYFLDFINTEEIGERDYQDIDERVVDQQIVHNIKKKIHHDFRQRFRFRGKSVSLGIIYSEEFFPDLLIFNRELNALVVVKLKTGKFKPEYLSQLMGYLRILDDKVKKPHENPSIDIVLCKEANKSFVEYIMQDYNKPMGVATYTTSQKMPESLKAALPNMNELKKLL